MDWYVYPALALGGFAAGIINVIAGGGSLITLPLIIFVGGLPATVANCTNRVGVLLQNVTAVASFRSLGVVTHGLGPKLLVPALIGTAIGAGFAITIDDEMFRRVLGVVMLVFVFVLLIDTKRWLREPDEAPRRMGAGLFLTFVGIGIYGGFVQAGVGIFIIAALVLGAKLDLVRTNAVKVWVVLGYTAFALAIFVWQGQVDFAVGLVVATGQAAGGVIGARLTVKKGNRWVRRVLIAVVGVSALKLLGAFDLAWSWARAWT